MPSKYQSKTRNAEKERLTAAELVRRHSLAILVRRYEVLRLTRGPERDNAERVLGVALARHHEPFALDGWIWSWSRGEQSILRQKAMAMHTVTKHTR